MGRDQGRLLSNWLRALWPLRLPHCQAQVEDGQGDWWQEDGGPSLPQVKRDGSVQLPASAAARVRQLQELRGSLPRGIHGRQWMRHVGKGHLLREEGGCRWRWRQEEVSHHCLSRQRCCSEKK